MQTEDRRFISKIVRDENGHPVGFVVAFAKDKIGWSCLNRRDRWNKEKAEFIAFNRAQNGWKAKPPKHVAEEIDHMVDRASRYFDNPNPNRERRPSITAKVL
jgi:hypothetical protein